MTATTLVLCVLFGLTLIIDHRRLARAARRPWGPMAPEPERWPHLTVIRPTKGADVEQSENFRAALATGYAGEVETLFVFEDEADPAHAIAREAIEAHRAAGGEGSARIVLAGAPPSSRTGKINNMIVGVAHASPETELIAFGDSDTRPDPQLLPELASRVLDDPKAGAAFAPAITTPEPRTVGDVGYGVILNAYLVASMLAQANGNRSLPFLMGQTMLFRREALEAIGGIECAEGQLVDDMYLGEQLVKAGWRNVLGTWAIPVINYGLGFGAFWKLWRRWLFFGRGGMPLGFVLPIALRGISVFAALGLIIWLLAAGQPLLALAPAALLLAEGSHYVRLHRLVGGAAIPGRILWAAWLPQPMALLIAISMLFDSTVEWRGRTYRLDLMARLRTNGDRS